MTDPLPHRYICFCGVTVIGAIVCSDCSEAMVRSLLTALPPRPIDPVAVDDVPSSAPAEPAAALAN